MQIGEWRIIDYFNEFIFGFVYHDIERCIEAKANYIAALALLSYTEYIGGLISGNLGMKDKAKENFEEALKYFPDERKPAVTKELGKLRKKMKIKPRRIV